MKLLMSLLPTGSPARLLLALVGTIVLVVSLVGMIIAYTSPATIDQETSLLDYEHRGQFDYTVYLKPSHLFGPSANHLAASYTYPAALVNTIDFTFSYTPLAQNTSEVWVSATLENADIWSKEIELVPKSSYSGDISLQFSLDVDEINSIYDTIQQETGITSSSRNLYINAYISTAEDELRHSLPIKLSSTLIEVNSTLINTFTTGIAEFAYVVNLKPNSLFDTTTLTSPTPSAIAITTLKPGDVIFPKLVDKMSLSYYYEFESSEPVDSLAIDVTIKAILEAPDIWAKEFLLLRDHKAGDFNVSTTMDLAGYLESLEEIRAETGVPVDAYNLTIIAEVRVVAVTPSGSVQETFQQQLAGIMEAGILTWESPLIGSQPGSITTTQTISNPKAVLGLSVPGARVALPILMAFSLALVSLAAASHLLYRRVGLADTERAVLRIKKKYGNRVIEATSQTPVVGERIVSLDSIESLVNTADELGKLIVHKPPTSPHEPHAYYVFDSITRYQYLLSTGYAIEDANSIKVEFFP